MIDDPRPEFGTAPLDRFTFCPSRQKEWDSMSQEMKDFTLKHIVSMTSKMENRMSIEMIGHLMNDMADRIEKLEQNQIDKILTE